MPMKSFIKLACIYFASAGMCLGATSLITFDDLAPLYNNGFYENPIPNGYNGLQWNNFWVLDAVDYFDAPSGYQYGMISAKNVAFNNYGNPALFSGNGTFDLDSAYLTAAWNDGLQVEVQGFVGNTLTYDNTYTLNTTAASFINFNYFGVDEVNFIASGGINHGFYGQGTQFAIDNMTVNLIPEPNLLALASLGAAALLACHRRK